MLKKKKAWQAWTNSLETLTGLLLRLTMSFPEEKLVQTSHTIYTPINTTVLLRCCPVPRNLFTPQSINTTVFLRTFQQ